ncbi:MAG: cyanophycinase [Bryobacteraceae bacterium]
MSRTKDARTTVSGKRGSLILVGGREERSGDRTILKEIARHARSSLLLVATLASEEPGLQWDSYRQAFADLDVSDIRHLQIEGREAASDPKNLEMVDNARVVYFTGGDQLKLASKLGGTPMLNRIRRFYEERGGVIAGTSAGASAMGATMLVSHATESSHKVESSFFMARGLGLVPDLVIDQHFAQRARIERLVGAVAEDPGVLGIGIDEDTAVILEDRMLRVTGSGAVYVADGQGVTYTNVSERTPDQTLRLYDLRLHVLSDGSTFDLETRRPSFVGGNE